MKWYGIEKGKYRFIEKVLMWKAKSLERFCRRHKLNYADIYLIDSDGSATINIRAKKGDVVVAEGYAFVKSLSKKR